MLLDLFMPIINTKTGFHNRTKSNKRLMDKIDGKSKGERIVPQETDCELRQRIRL
jgi:hypothetical protein